jgi:tetratricopeptide (TPR) repeat protein
MTGEGEFALIKHHLECALHAPTSWMGDQDVYATLIDVAAMHADEATIRQYAPLAEEIAERHGHMLYQAIAQRAWGVAQRLAGEYAESAARLKQALAIFQSLDTRWQIGRTRYELGQLAAGQGDQDSAHAHFTDALADFEAMGAVPDLARTRAAVEQRHAGA